MTNNESLELPEDTRLRSIYDNSETIYRFKRLKSINNIVNAFVQKIDGNNVDMLHFPLNYFQNEFVIYIEPPVEVEIIEEIIPVEVEKKSKK